jgi:O-antigen/teichoic acid export membrane protein
VLQRLFEPNRAVSSDPPDHAPPAASATAQTTLRAEASRSLFWTAAGKYVNSLLTLGVMAVLSRKLSPEDFGLVAMVTVVSAFLAVLADAGLATTVVQKRELSHDALSTLFWASLGLGAVMAGLMLLASPIVARVFGEPRLVTVMSVLGVGFVTGALGKVPTGLLTRALDFRSTAMSDTLAAVLAGTVGVTLALLGAGYWALVVQSLTNGFVNAVIRFWASGFRPRWVFAKEHLGSASQYSGGVVAFNAINYWARNLDKALIGRYLGSAELGYYGRAYALMLLPLDTLNGVLGPVLHPLLARLQDDRARMARAYSRIAKLVACVALPVMAALAALAPEVVRTLWGPQWGRSVDVFAVLCLIGGFQPVSATFGSVFLALNRTRLLAIVGFVNAGILMLGMALGVPFGIIGVATGYASAYALIFLPTLAIVVIGLLGGTTRDLVSLLIAPILIGACVFAVLVPYNWALRGRWPELAHLTGGLALALVAWIAAFALLDRATLHDALGLLPAGARTRLQGLLAPAQRP